MTVEIDTCASNGVSIPLKGLGECSLARCILEIGRGERASKAEYSGPIQSKRNSLPILAADLVVDEVVLGENGGLGGLKMRMMGLR